MSITSDLIALKEELDQRSDAFSFRSECQRFYGELSVTISELQAIIDHGHFDTIPLSIKTELAQFRTLLTTLQSDIDGDAGIMEVLATF